MADETKDNNVSIFEDLASKYDEDIMYKKDVFKNLAKDSETLGGLKVFLLDTLLEEVGSYIRSQHMALYDDKNPLYIEYIKLMSEIKDLEKETPSRETYEKGKGLYARTMALIGTVNELKKNSDGENRGPRK